MSKPAVFLSVIIPSYNEKKNLSRGVLTDVYTFLQKQKYSFEMVLTDDGSNDGTVEALRAFAKGKTHVRILENYHMGKGPTVISGMLAASGEYRLFTDFDQSTPIEEVNRALGYIHEGYDIVIGSREGVGALRKEEPLHRHLMGRMFNAVVQVMALRGIQDSQCGFKVFSYKATQELFSALVIYGNQTQRNDAYTGAFDVELLFLARKWGYKVKEMGVQWEHNETDRVNPLKDSFRMFRDILRIRLAWLMGKYA